MPPTPPEPLGPGQVGVPDALPEFGIGGLPVPAVTWPAPRQVPTSYPGPAPDHHYLLVGEGVVPLTVEGGRESLRVTLADGTPVDEALAAVGAAPLAERVPVLAYGANRSPHSLALKLAHHGYDGPGPPAVPVLAGTLADLDVVAAGLSSQGFVYADVAPSPGTRISVLLTLLDPGQAAAIHDSEGVGRGLYECAWVGGFDVAGAHAVTLDAIAYAGCRPVFVSPELGGPLAFSAIAATGRTFAADEQVGILAHVLRTTGAAGPVADLLGLPPPAPASASGDEVAVARELARLLSGQWWYTHNTGDQPLELALRAERLVRQALAGHVAPTSTAERLAADGKVVPAATAYATPPEFLLATQLQVA